MLLNIFEIGLTKAFWLRGRRDRPKKALSIKNTIPILSTGLALLTGCGGSSTSSSGPVDPSLYHYYVYAVNRDSNSVSIMQADQSGKLTKVGTVSTGKGPVAITSDEQDVYVANSLDNTISCYVIDTGGILIPTATIPTGSNPRAIVGSYSANLFGRVSVACNGDQIIVYNVLPGPTLQEAGRATVGKNPVAVLSGFGAIYSANYDSGTISGVAKSTLTLENPGSHPVGSGPIALEERIFSGNSTVGTRNGLLTLYTLNSKSNTVSVYKENSDTAGAAGPLTLLGTGSTGVTPVAFATTYRALGDTGDDFPSDALFVLNRGSETISVLTSDPKTQALTSRLSGIEASSGAKPTDIKNAHFLNLASVVYVTTEGGTIRRYAEGSNMHLTYMDDVQTGGTTPVAMAITPIETPEILKLGGTVPAGTVGKKYSGSFTANYDQVGNWKLTAGSLPPGLSLAKANGNEILAGTPSQAGTFTFTLQASTFTQLATKQFSIEISNQINLPLGIATTGFAQATVGLSYTSPPLRITGGDGSQSASWSVNSGTLPPGLGLFLAVNNVDVLITGTPTKAGNYTFSLEAEQGKKTAVKSLTLNVSTSTVGGTSVRFLNADADAIDKSLTFTLAGTAFPGTSFGSLSTPQSIASGSSVPYTLVNGSGTSLPAGKTFVSDGQRNIMVALGANDATRKLAFMFFPPTFPGNPGAGLSFMNGISTPSIPKVDVYLLDNTGEVVAEQFTLSYGDFTTFATTPDSFQLKVTVSGSPNQVLALSPLEAVASGQNMINVAVAPASGGADTVLHITE